MRLLNLTRLLLALTFWVRTSSLLHAADAPPVKPAFTRIDAHVHIFVAPKALGEMLARQDMQALTICCVDKYARGYEQAVEQRDLTLAVRAVLADRVAWCSTFDPADFEAPDFAQRTIRELKDSFARGAVAVKIYKSMGMELKREKGGYVLPDDPVFAPIFEMMIDNNKTLFAHLAEPDAAWKPIEPGKPHSDFFKSNPAWHMYGHPDRPSKADILAARDRLLAKYPKLRMVGCHLGSMEADVDDIAARFDRYPNFAVDTAARVPDLMRQPRDKVRNFLIKYADRVLYGTDLGMMRWQDPAQAMKAWESRYAHDWAYFATDQMLNSREGKVQGLALPEEVLRKLYRDNALKWVPGMKPN